MPVGNAERENSGALRSAGAVVPVLLAMLLAGSIVFYKERMLFIDAPHVLWRIINDGKLMLSDFRYGSFISQVFPLFGSKMHLPLRWLTLLYSCGFYVFYLAVGLLLVYKFRNYALAVLFGL